MKSATFTRLISTGTSNRRLLLRMQHQILFKKLLQQRRSPIQNCYLLL